MLHPQALVIVRAPATPVEGDGLIPAEEPAWLLKGYEDCWAQVVCITPALSLAIPWISVP